MNLTNEDNSKEGRTPLGVTQNLQQYSVLFVKQSSVFYMHYQFNTQQSYVLYVFTCFVWVW